MFSFCVNLEKADLHSNMPMKAGIRVNNTTSMLWKCKSLTKLDTSGFITSSVRNMRSMFFECENLTQLDESGFELIYKGMQADGVFILRQGRTRLKQKSFI